jgi:integrase/recombinase XerD
MFEEIFAQGGALERHRSSPLAIQRSNYLRYCAEQGWRRSTLQQLASNLLLLQKVLGLEGSDVALDHKMIEAAVNRWVHRRPKHCRQKTGLYSRYRLLSLATHWLDFMQRLSHREKKQATYQHFIDEFVDYMRHQRGLSEETIETRCWYINDFLEGLQQRDRSLGLICTADVDEAIARKGRDHGYSRLSIQVYASGIRVFLRYAERRGWCSSGLADSVESPRTYQHETLPMGPPWDDVQELLASSQGTTPKDLRDRAILYLLAVYGLRSREVRLLKLEDLDWERSLVTVSRDKGRRREDYPLTSATGEAILRYLQHARPTSRYREVFLSVEAPIQPLSSSGLWVVVASRLRRLNRREHGPHALRHACATHLLANGLSMKEVGDHLGHRLTKTTAVYAKVDAVKLREVAEFTLGGLA